MPVSIGDIVRNTATGEYAEVIGIDSNTQLSLDKDIMSTGQAYTIESSDAAKGRYKMINTYNWDILDSGPI